ncbi:MAG: FecR family protein [Candidatus Omnitrophota bacterium]
MNMKSIMLALLLLSLAPAIAFAQAAEIGKVVTTEGRVDVTRLPDNEAVMLTDGSPVFTGDFIRTKDHSKAEIAFADRSTVKIAPNTRIEIKDFAVNGSARERAEIDVSRGKIIADVSRTGKPDTFTITTPNAKGSVRGTEVVVIYQADTTSALVKDGRLSICNVALPDDKRMIAGGEATMIQFDTPPKEPRSYMDAEFMMHEKDAKPVAFRAVSLGKEADKMRGVVTEMAGGVRILKNGAYDWNYAKPNDVLEEGDKIETADDGRASVSFENGNLLILQSNSRVMLATMRKDPKTGEFDNTFESDGGKIKAVVEKLGKKSTFRVKTPTALCGVRGTVMYVNVAAGATQAFYEGGGGVVTNPVSGDTAFVESGQNTVSTSAGQVSAPIATSTEAKMTLDASYDYGMVQGGYSAPENTTAGSGGHGGQRGDRADMAADLDTGTGGGGFNPPPDLVPITEANRPRPNPGVSFIQDLNFTGLVGRVDSDGTFDPEAPVNPVNGTFSLSVSVNNEWTTVGKGAVNGNVARTAFIPSSYAFWTTTNNIRYSTSNNGQYRGFLGASISTSTLPATTTLWGKALCLYRDPSGWAGTMTFLFGGKYDESNKSFYSILEDSDNVVFTAREFVGPNFNLNAMTLTTGTMYGRGTGYFYGTGSGNITCGATGVDTGLSGTTFDIDSDWGIWQFSAQGTYATGDTSDDWALALGGEREDDPAHPTYWMGAVDGDLWDDRGAVGTRTNQATGEFEGVVFWVSDDTSGVNDKFEGGTILNGHIVGIADPVFSKWQAIGGGEFLIAYKDFTQANLGFSASQLAAFVNVPISEVAAVPMTGSVSGGFTLNMNMDTRVYQSGASYMWTGTIGGTYSSPPTGPWTITLTGTASSMKLDGPGWDMPGQTWTATVDTTGLPATKTIAGYTITAGQAGGIFKDDGTIEGVAAGVVTT